MLLQHQSLFVHQYCSGHTLLLRYHSLKEASVCQLLWQTHFDIVRVAFSIYHRSQSLQLKPLEDFTSNCFSVFTVLKRWVVDLSVALNTGFESLSSNIWELKNRVTLIMALEEWLSGRTSGFKGIMVWGQGNQVLGQGKRLHSETKLISEFRQTSAKV